MGKWKEMMSRHHSLIMIFCCILFFALLLLATRVFGIQNSSFYWIALLLCPLMHFFMMKDMHKHDAGEDKKEHKGGCH
ncbi:DUF2933 domain-containing protein [Candidatus Woesearchaeota archaeon]|nr:DUF2933 domain-containing protein [Candidatus Woesearchaeota archaeon]